jgi:hypothetical protein
MVDAGRACGHNRAIAQSCRHHFDFPLFGRHGAKRPSLNRPPETED